MKTVLDLYKKAEKKGYEIVPWSCPETGSMSEPGDSGDCYIAIDEKVLDTTAELKTHLAHEIAHCDGGYFYNRYSPIDDRRRMENKADKRAIRDTISQDDLDNAVAEGYTELWQLAEYFDVTVAFMQKVVCFYVYGSLDTELHF